MLDRDRLLLLFSFPHPASRGLPVSVRSSPDDTCSSQPHKRRNHPPRAVLHLPDGTVPSSDTLRSVKKRRGERGVIDEA